MAALCSEDGRGGAVAGGALLEGPGARAGGLAGIAVVGVARGAGDKGPGVCGAGGGELAVVRVGAVWRREALGGEAVLWDRGLVGRDGADRGLLAVVAVAGPLDAKGSLGGLDGAYLAFASLVHGETGRVGVDMLLIGTP